MSYEEARLDRQRSRKNQSMQAFLTMLQQAGGAIAARSQREETLKQQHDMRELESQDRWELEKYRQEQEAARWEARNRTDIEEAKIRGAGGGSIPEWRARAQGIAAEYGGDPSAALKALRERQSGYDQVSQGEAFKADQSAIDSLIAAQGFNSLAGQRAEPQPTGDMMGQPSQPQQSAIAMGPRANNMMAGAGAAAAGGAGGIPGISPGPWSQANGGMVTGQRGNAAQLGYASMADAYRRFMATGDPVAFEQLNQLYGGALGSPRWLQQRKMQGAGPNRMVDTMGTTVAPR
jgi:hypothetical protein